MENAMAHVLIVDESESFCDRLGSAMQGKGFQVTHARSLQDGYGLGEHSDIDAVLLSGDQLSGSELEQLQRFRGLPSAPEVIVLAEAANAAEAVRVINSGAWDYIAKSSLPASLIEPLSCLAASRQRKKAADPCGEIDPEGTFADIVGRSSRLRMCLDLLAKAACSDVNVLLDGETGTGKEMFAVALHRNSARQKNNFVVVDCAALPETLVESILFGHEKGAFTGATRHQVGLVKHADQGTLFLDEVGELPLTLQKSFLRVLEGHQFRPVGGQHEIGSDFRLVAATNQDLDAMVADGKFRADLLFRLRTFSIRLPSLRERRGDLNILIDHFLTRLEQQNRMPKKIVSTGFLAALHGYGWPGNVRELLHALERSVAAATDEPVLLARHLPTYIRVEIAEAGIAPIPAGGWSADFAGPAAAGSRTANVELKTMQEMRQEAIAAAEQNYLRQLVSNTRGNIKKACRISGLSRSRLYQLLKDHHISSSGGGGSEPRRITEI